MIFNITYSIMMMLKGGQGYVYNFKDDAKSVEWKSDGYTRFYNIILNIYFLY